MGEVEQRWDGLPWRADHETWVDATPFRVHLQHLMAASRLPVDAVAHLARISPRTARALLQGRDGRPVRKVSPDTARRLLRVTVRDAKVLSLRRVCAEATRARVTSLVLSGLSLSELAAATAVPEAALREILDGSTSCSERLAVQVKAFSTGRLPPRQAGGPARPQERAA
jgi:plasmid maintenance system antidote protein VapI